ncbi:glucose-1-phosphate thymidylyltransferase RfbA [Novispirillum itersonii]|uniref:glucose-1-phosphate thymidylyltransferase RfbA n=1 Tax=Novispirillum itersonii TaxID=189 RepID=UPI000476370E|nr:glucose-1-phosphate thymidylyltransferase RfbA [Novispirillum itersonii]
MKGILLAGGSGTRLLPLTQTLSKQLLPVYNKPLIYYPLSTLMLAGIREILIISTPRDLPMIERLLGDGSQIGLSLHYAVQEKPNGIAEAFTIGADFLQGEPVCLVLGDNIFHSHELPHLLARATNRKEGASVLACRVSNPSAYGVVELDATGKPIRLVEKPAKPASNWAVTGLYFYDGQVHDIARSLRPSQRGELEITDINQIYLERGQLNIEFMGRGAAWFDAGTFDSLLGASQYVHMLEVRQGLMIGLPEEIAWRMNYISTDDVRATAKAMRNNPLGNYLLGLLDEPRAHA